MSTVLKTNALCKKYGSKIVTNNISLTINKGDIYGFIGKNGAGKTTFMRQVLGMAFPNSGEIELFGSKKLNEQRKKIGSLIEAPAIYAKCSAYENMKRMAMLTSSSDAEVKSILDYVGLGNTGNKSADQFSLGMRQRLGIAIALLGNPEFLILDEPINGLDPSGIMEVRDLILKLNKEKGITFLISSHLLEELSKVATCYGFISNGKLIEEISAVDLETKCCNRVKIAVDNVEKSAKLLEQIAPANDIHIYQNVVFVDSNFDKTAQMNKLLIENGVMVSEMYLHAISLEDYFLKKVGAENG